MAVCPACDAEMDVDEFDVEPGDELSCPECGANLEVATVLPVELTLAGEEDDEESYELHESDGGMEGGSDGEREDDTDWEA